MVAPIRDGADPVIMSLVVIGGVRIIGVVFHYFRLLDKRGSPGRTAARGEMGGSTYARRTPEEC
jgi:hypothetical protein